MGAIPSRRNTARRLATPALLAVLLPLLAAPAQAHPLFDTTRLLQQQGNACVGATGCKVIASEPRRIKVGQADDITAHCPDAHPFLVNWDASHHEHIGITQLERRPGGVTIVAINHADAPGRVTLHIGCAKERPGRTPELQSLQALPSKALRAQRLMTVAPAARRAIRRSWPRTAAHSRGRARPACGRNSMSERAICSIGTDPSCRKQS